MTQNAFDDIAAVETLTGVRFSEMYHRFFAPQLAHAATLLREAHAAGMELDRVKLSDVAAQRTGRSDLLLMYTELSKLHYGE